MAERVPRTLSPEEAARAARLPASTVRHHIQSGALASLKIGRHRRIRLADLLKFTGLTEDDLEPVSA